ncbi:zinc finger protein 41-like isoform X1 [Pararge aegeria]|uniref:zinc finger protein 41-like isoform X1 n=2 Tax=Pararge aegeria TaxID=116150 RepID=UPI0019CFD2D1|nr:zinc finger protein 41-like isoform X1 [Pararge aegeria]
MKRLLKNIIQTLLKTKGSCCTLCFKSIGDEINSLRVTDKVIFESESDKSIREILNFILASDISGDFLNNYICQKCAESAFSTYLFIKMVKNNYEYFHRMMHNMDSVLDENLECVKTMYLLNEDSKFQSCYDTKCNINTVEAAKLRLQTLYSDEYNDENTISIELVLEKPKESNNDYDNMNNKRSRSPMHKKSNRNTLADMCERDGPRNVKCKLCLKVFHTLTNFRSHYKRLHAPKTIKCPKCPKLFGSTTILKQHRKECHLDAMCAKCGKAFNNYNYLKIHELSHEVSFTCEICKRVYKTKETFNTHLHLKICGQKQRKNQNEAQFTCDICGKKFCRKTSLRIHITFQHGNGKAYICDFCSKRFRYQSQLSTHIKKHTHSKLLMCYL